jgi:hypothetical protein
VLCCVVHKHQTVLRIPMVRSPGHHGAIRTPFPVSRRIIGAVFPGGGCGLGMFGSAGVPVRSHLLLSLSRASSHKPLLFPPSQRQRPLPPPPQSTHQRLNLSIMLFGIISLLELTKSTMTQWLRPVGRRPPGWSSVSPAIRRC